ncbi:MAG: hypothetical protein Q4C12_03745 [Clostridia bacterium]|nr:hypothetical protein [Clostridia bacterium]
MATEKRMPPLKIDEVILLVDAYFRMKEIELPSSRNECISELSNSMRSLPFYPNLRDNNAFRSCAGMSMCLANVGCIDPENSSHFGHGSNLQKEVFNYYSNKLDELKGIATSIRSVSNHNMALREEYEDYIGGQLPVSYHCHLESVDKTVQRIKKESINYGKSHCVICGDDLKDKYGDAAMSIMEAHIAVPLSQHRVNMNISTTDILLLCPACHRLAHSDPELFYEASLKKRVKEWQIYVQL